MRSLSHRTKTLLPKGGIQMPSTTSMNAQEGSHLGQRQKTLEGLALPWVTDKILEVTSLCFTPGPKERLSPRPPSFLGAFVEGATNLKIRTNFQGLKGQELDFQLTTSGKKNCHTQRQSGNCQIVIRGPGLRLRYFGKSSGLARRQARGPTETGDSAA